MRYKLVDPKPGSRVWVLIFDSGDEVMEGLNYFASHENVLAASFIALGAFKSATLAYFDWEQKKYQPIPVDEQVEVVSLMGDIAQGDDGRPSLHAHAMLGRRDGTAKGGHLQKAIVRPTLEVKITETPAHLSRHARPGLGIATIDIDG